MIQKLYSKARSSSCVDIHRDTITFETDGMVYKNLNISRTKHDFT